MSELLEKFVGCRPKGWGTRIVLVGLSLGWLWSGTLGCRPQSTPSSPTVTVPVSTPTATPVPPTPTPRPPTEAAARDTPAPTGTVGLRPPTPTPVAPTPTPRPPTEAAAGNTPEMWGGEWNRVGSSGWFEDASLSITTITAASFEFELFAMSGSHLGEIAGTAQIQQNEALYEDEESGCQIEFSLADQALLVKTTPDCIYYAGVGVFFDGEYRQEKQEKVLTLQARGMLESEAQEEAFSKLVGDDYALFLNTAHLVFEEEDLDGFGATVRTAGVRGLFTIMESIIMIDSRGTIWAAVIEPEADVVKYFTNDPRYGDSLPKTIEQWRERFPHKPVLFMGDKDCFILQPCNLATLLPDHQPTYHSPRSISAMISPRGMTADWQRWPSTKPNRSTRP